jgi:hypothetical protein
MEKRSFRMLKKIAKSIALLSLLSAATAQALPMVQADAFSAGDNKAALETSTGLVWMDFGVNSHRTFSDVMSSLDTDYAGWRLPTIAEVDHLWTGLFGGLDEWSRLQPTFASLSTIDKNITMYDDYFNSLMEVFGSVVGLDGHYTHTRDGVLIYSATYTYKSSFAVFSDSGVNGFVNLFVPTDNNIVPRHAAFSYEMLIPFLQDISLQQGTLLVKKSTNVPEPASGLLAVLAIFMLAVRRFNFGR